MGVKVFETVGGAFSALVNNKALLIIALISAILSSLLLVYAEFGTISAGILEPSAIVPLLVVIVALLVAVLLIGAAISAVGEGNDLGEAFSHSIRRYASLLGASILLAIIVGIGFVLLIIPGIYLIIRLCLTQPAVMLEDRGAVDALKRSWQLTSGNWWSIFAVAFIVVVIIFIIRLVFYILPTNANLVAGALVEGFLEYAAIAAYVLIFQQLAGKVMMANKAAAPAKTPQKKKGSKKTP